MTQKITQIQGVPVENLSAKEKRNLISGIKLANSFLQRASQKHNNKYSYPVIPDVLHHKDKIKIICPDHKEFEQSVNHHLNGRGCPWCAKEISKNNKQELNSNYKSQDKFLLESKKKYGDKYDYELLNYSGMSNQITLKCIEHNLVFNVIARNHLRSINGSCPICTTNHASEIHTNNLKDFIDKSNLVHDNKYDYSLVEYVNNKTKIKIICPKHGVFEQTPVRHIYGDGCSSCGYTSSKPELEIQKFLLENNINFISNDRKLLDGVELDLFLPDYNLGIEYNGLYWHSTRTKPINYHLDKLKLCQEKRIKLIQIFEDEWVYKKEIVKSILKQRLNLTKNKIYARKCEIKEINNKNHNQFLEENHLQGISYNSKIKLGLYYNEQLVSVMSFGKPSLSGGNKNYEWNLDRFAVLINTSIVGGFSKLLKYFITNYSPKSLFTSADLRYSEGNVYLKNGFKLSHQTKPNYWYTKPNTKPKRYHRFNFRKSLLNKKLENFSYSLTEKENMVNNGWEIIHDCGNLILKFDF